MGGVPEYIPVIRCIQVEAIIFTVKCKKIITIKSKKLREWKKVGLWLQLLKKVQRFVKSYFLCDFFSLQLGICVVCDDYFSPINKRPQKKRTKKEKPKTLLSCIERPQEELNKIS